MNPVARTLTRLLLAALLLALGGLFGGWWVARQPVTDTGAPQSGERKVLYWYDPMHPQQRFEQPGKSPFMDMALLPKYADEAVPGSEGVRIDARVAQNLGIRRAQVKRIALTTQIEVTGLIGWNERELSIEQTRAAGFVERVWPLAVGDWVEAGQPLIEMTVPEWAAAQYEFLALQAQHDSLLIDAARERLALLGISQALIRQIEQSRVAQPKIRLTASRSGVIEALEVRAGMTLMPGQTVARINGIANLWLDAAVPESAADSVALGSQAEVWLVATPGKRIKAQVAAILPQLNEASRTLRVRLELANGDGALRPGMSARVRLEKTGQGSALAVPTEAVIRTGKRSLLIVQQEDGALLPVEVEPGAEIGDQTVIESGLSEGQTVVASGQFLIDSEASMGGVLHRSAGEQIEHVEQQKGHTP